MSRDIGVDMFRQMKPNRDSARACVRTIVRYRKHPGKSDNRTVTGVRSRRRWGARVMARHSTE